MSQILNGMRTYRPDLSKYIFPTETFRQQVMNWSDGVPSGKATRALLLSGVSGLGKTTLALALAKQLGADPNDIQELNCANTRTLDDARQLGDTFQMMPMRGKYRVFILDEIHQLMGNAQQMLLTPLEKLPDTTLVIACTSEADMLVRAFRNRFYELRFTEYPEEAIVEILMGLPDVKHPPAMLAKIARVTNGVPRAAIALAEKNPDTPEVQEALAQELLTAEKFIEALFQDNFTMMFVLAGLVKEDNKRVFYDRTIKYLEALWAMRQGLQVAMSSQEKEFLGKWKEAPKKTGELFQILPTPLTTTIGSLYGQLVDLSTKPAGQLRAWVIAVHTKQSIAVSRV